MTKVKSITDIAALYESVRTPKKEVIEEKAAKYPKGTFPQSTKEVEATTDFEKSGPNKALGIKKKKKNKKNSKNSRKVVEDNINSFMKSEFDKLFENVMGDEPSFEVEPSMGPEGAEGDMPEMDETGSEDVTITLSKDLAQQLHDVLMGVLEGEGESEGEAEELEDLGIDLSDEDSAGEEEGLNDATEMKEVPESQGQKLMSRGSMKGPGNVTNKQGSKASHTTATDKQGNETKGHPLDKDERLHQKVEGQSVTNKVNKPFFQ